MSLIGSVKWFSAKRGFGFITVMTQDLDNSNTDVFVHFSNLNVSSEEYKRLFPGEYVSFNMGKGKDGRDVCIDVTGVMGGPLLTDNPDVRYRFFPKNPRQEGPRESTNPEVSEQPQSEAPDENDPEE